MRDLAEAGRSVIDSPAAPPTPIDQIEARAHGRRRRGRARAAVALVTAVALIGGAVAIAADRHSPPSPVATTHPPKTTVTPRGHSKPPSDPKLRAHLGFDAPKGWKPADYGAARLWVPLTWNQAAANDCSQPSGRWILYSVGSFGQVLCGPIGPTGPSGRPTPTTTPPTPTSPSITITKFAAPPIAGAPHRVVNSYSVFTKRGPGSALTWAVPALDVTLKTTTAFEQELETIGPSAHTVALDFAPESIPSDWRRVTDKGISIAVPDDWPTRLVTDPYCVHFDPGTVWVGAIHQTQQRCSSPDDLRFRSTPADGAWLVSGVPLEPAATAVPGPWDPGLHVSMYPGGGPLLLVYVNVGKQFRSLQIGLGPDGRIANAILHSIKIAPTPSFGVSGCAPTPDRVTLRETTPAHPIVSDHPTRATLCAYSTIKPSSQPLIGATDLDASKIATTLDRAPFPALNGGGCPLLAVPRIGILHFDNGSSRRSTTVQVGACFTGNANGAVATPSALTKTLESLVFNQP